MSVRIFVGTEPKTDIAAKVLAHTITTKTKAKVEITEMIGPDWEYPIKGIKVGTGFSLRRWMIPKACNWHGYALYLDADQIVFGDIQELWDRVVKGAEIHFPGAIAWTTYQPDKYYKYPAPQTSVMGLNCDNAFGKWGFEIDKVLAHLKGHPDKQTYAWFMHAEWMRTKNDLPSLREAAYNCFDHLPGLPEHPIHLPVEWNHLNVYENGKTKLLHYTKEDEQVWYCPEHPLAKHWHFALEGAIDAGLVTQEMLRQALSQWGKREDWRKKNGLHPWYKRYLKS